MNIGMPLTEFVLETVLRDGLGELRATPSKLDYLFARFLEPQFNNQYGSSKVTQIKDYVVKNQVKLVHAFSLNSMVAPSISIQIIASEETPNLQTLGNVFGTQFEHKNRAVILSNVVPSSYDTVSGKLQLDPSTDLSTILQNQIFIDSDSNEFLIKAGISNAMGNKFINIGSGQEPTLNLPGAILDPIDFDLYSREQVRLTETIRLGIHAKGDAHLTKFLYYIVYYILKSRQKSLITRGIHLDFAMMSSLDRDDSYEGENIYSRFIDMRCQTEFNYIIDQLAVASCFDVNVYVPDPKPDSPDKRKL